MADNVTINDASDVAVPIAADEISGKQHQRVKVQHGADGSATDVSSASPMPVGDAAVLAKLTADPATQTTLAAILAKIVAAPATEATLGSILTELGQKLEPGGEVALSSATLTALETISVARGTLGYDAGTSAGTVDVPAGARARFVSLIAGASAATLTVNGGDTITVPAGAAFDREFAGDATLGGDVVIGGTITSYYVEWVTP
jgi:hypothetical protein